MESIKNLIDELHEPVNEYFKNDFSCHIINNHQIQKNKICNKEERFREYYPLCRHEKKDNEYYYTVPQYPPHGHDCIEGIGIFIPSQYISELDKISLNIEIGRIPMDTVENLLVFILLNSAIKFIDGTFHIPLFRNIISSDNPLFFGGIVYHTVRINFMFRDNVNKKRTIDLTDFVENIKFYVDYTNNRYNNEVSQASLIDSSLHSALYTRKWISFSNEPIVFKKIFQSQNICKLVQSNQSIQIYISEFCHPSHYFYLYYDDYLDHLKNLRIDIMNVSWNCLDIEKLKINSDNLLEIINNDILQYRNVIAQNLSKINNDIIDYIVTPYLYQDVSETFANKTIYRVMFDPNFDSNDCNFKTHTINLSRIPYIILTIESDEIKNPMTIHIGCLSSNLLVQSFKLGMSGSVFAI